MEQRLEPPRNPNAEQGARLNDLRELAHGIYPPLLADKGAPGGEVERVADRCLHQAACPFRIEEEPMKKRCNDDHS